MSDDAERKREQERIRNASDERLALQMKIKVLEAEKKRLQEELKKKDRG